MQGQSIKLCECGCGNPAPIARRANPKRGHVKGHPVRFIAGHNAKVPNVSAPSALERFHAKVDKGGPVPDCAPHLGHCWIWQAAINAQGYGVISADGKPQRAHRWYYEQVRGTATCDLDHLCRVRHCVNPDHLEPVSRGENIRRGNAAKVGPADVAAIRHSTLPAATLAKRYGISDHAIGDIRRGKSWRDVP